MSRDGIPTLTQVYMEMEEGDPRIAQVAIDARNEALMLGAPSLDAAAIGIETIDRLVREQTARWVEMKGGRRP